MIDTLLTDYEIVQGFLVAGQRMAYNLTHDYHPRSSFMDPGRNIGGVEDAEAEGHVGDPNDMWGPQVVGALGEIAFAKVVNKFWSGAIGNYGADDVGKWQVRATNLRDGRLWSYPKDKDNRRYFLVRIDCLRATIVGWMYGSDAKAEAKRTKSRYVSNTLLTDVVLPPTDKED